MSIIENIRVILDRELQSLSDEVNAYGNSNVLWTRPEGISNSAGSLALHLCGNLRHYIGAQLGDSDYVRDRRFEFSGEPVPVADLIKIIEETRLEIESALMRISDDDLDSEYPLEVGGVSLSTGQFLFHLVSHLGYHLGQIDYHRRMETGNNTAVGTVSIRKLVGST